METPLLEQDEAPGNEPDTAVPMARESAEEGALDSRQSALKDAQASAEMGEDDHTSVEREEVNTIEEDEETGGARIARLSTREGLLTGTIRKRRRCCMKRYWCGYCCMLALVCFLAWFIVVLPVVRTIITSRVRFAPIDVRSAFIHLDDTHPIITTDLLQVIVLRSAWSLGFLLDWITFTAEVPPVNATLYVHLPNGTVVKSGRFESTTSMTMKSWEDLRANISGVLHPDMSLVKELFLATLKEPVLKIHFSTVVSIRASVLGFPRITIPKVPMTSAVLTIQAMNNFLDTPMVMQEITSIVGTNDTLSMVVRMSMQNPTLFGCKIEDDLKLDALYGSGRLGSIEINNLTMLPKHLGPTTLDAHFNYERSTAPNDIKAMDDALHAYIGEPTGFNKSGVDPIKAAGGAPRSGFPAKNPMLRTALSGDFVVNATIQPKPIWPLREVNVTLPFFDFWRGALVVFRVENPLPAEIVVDGVVADIYYVNLTGQHLYRFDQNFTDDTKLIIPPMQVNDLEVRAAFGGFDKGAFRLLTTLALAAHHHHISVGVRVNFTVTIHPSFTITVPYVNHAIDSNLRFKAWV
eukprot:GEMP01006868.1.p1 GENE.GEMP01006868.1~~GEMP01006868.1.p1  ORF type:complete len:578 (+),score=143.77 GEMP01006868.1:280-2013(+)